MSFALLAGIVSLLAYLPLVKAWQKGDFVPHRATWIIWSITSGLTALAMNQGGAGLNILTPIGFLIGSGFIATLAFKRGVGGWETLDKVCITISAIGIIFWLKSGSPTQGLLFQILADAAGGIPTIIKAWKEPDSESPFGWMIFLVGGVIMFIAAKDY